MVCDYKEVCFDMKKLKQELAFYKELPYVIAVCVAILVFFLALSFPVQGYQIITEDDFENETLTFCNSFYGSDNFTLSCLDYFLFFKDNVYVSVVDDIPVCNVTFVNQTFYTNVTYNTTEVLQVYHNQTIVENHTCVLDELSAKDKAEFELKKLMIEKGMNPDGLSSQTTPLAVPDGFVPSTDVQAKIDQAIASYKSGLNPPDTSVVKSGSGSKKDIPTFYLVVGVFVIVMVFNFLYKKFFSKSDARKMPFSNTGFSQHHFPKTVKPSPKGPVDLEDVPGCLSDDLPEPEVSDEPKKD